MTELLTAYWVSAGLGFIYIVGSAALGHLHGSEEVHGGHDSGDGGDPGDVDSGDPGDVDSGGPDDVDGGDPGDVDGSSQAQAHRVGQQQNILVAKSPELSETWYFKTISFLSPTKISLYLFFIGAIGVTTLTLLPALGYFSLIPALIVGYAIGRAILNVFGLFVSKLNASTNFKQESLVGSVGDLILSIDPGQIGEVVVSTRGSRHSAPARARKSDLTIKRNSKVIICDFQDGVFLVEPVEEDLQNMSI
ncbi:MAG: hypothetical protein K2X27_28215 [Candidatus Obscuribacterales bacterium]|nr:hypothetical protein [Candidatus Obscuribacterales bacterium]